MASDSDEELKQRKEELEEELDAYARAGVVSPSLIKGARWVSRLLWVGLIAVVVVMFWQNRGRVSERDYEAAVKSAHSWKDKAAKAQEETNKIEPAWTYIELSAKAEGIVTNDSPLVVATELVKSLKKRAEKATVSASTSADHHQAWANELLARMRAEVAYAKHWQEYLGRDAGSKDDALAMLKQASSASEARRFELVREAAEKGREPIRLAALEMLKTSDIASIRVGAMVLARLGSDEAELRDAASRTKDSEVMFLHAVLRFGFGGTRIEGASEHAESWLVEVANAQDGIPLELRQTWQSAKAVHKPALFAMICASAISTDVEFLGGVANSTRTMTERILAVRALGRLRAKASVPMLSKLAAKDDELGSNAKAALDRIRGAN